MEKNKFKDSPFYVKYNGTKKNTKTYGYHVRKDFEKPLKEFFDVKFGNMSDSDIMEQIVYDYYFSYAHERTSYPINIIALMKKEDYNKDNPKIVPYILFKTEKHENDLVYELMKLNKKIDMKGYFAWQYTFSYCDKEIKELILNKMASTGIEWKGANAFKDMGGITEDILDNFIVFEIPLNNYFDSKFNGIYCYESEDANNVGVADLTHVGISIVRYKSDDVEKIRFPIIYEWSYVTSDEVRINSIHRISFDELQDLCFKYNPQTSFLLQLVSDVNMEYEYKEKELLNQISNLEDELKDKYAQLDYVRNIMDNEN